MILHYIKLVLIVLYLYFVAGAIVVGLLMRCNRSFYKECTYNDGRLDSVPIVWSIIGWPIIFMYFPYLIIKTIFLLAAVGKIPKVTKLFQSKVNRMATFLATYYLTSDWKAKVPKDETEDAWEQFFRHGIEQYYKKF